MSEGYGHIRRERVWNVMPFQAKNSDSYVVFLKPKSISWKRDICIAVLTIEAACTLVSLINLHRISELGFILNLTILLASVAAFRPLFRSQRPDEAPGRVIRVSGEQFRVEELGKAGKVYRFAEIERVRCRQAWVMGGRQATLGPVFWEIYVGSECVAAFFDRTENAMRLLEKLDRLGLITPYGTGVK